MNAAARLHEATSSGDPIADAAIESVLQHWSGHSGRVDGDLLAAVERLAERGDHACRAFVCAVFVHPSWVDFDLLQAGQRLGLALAPATGAVLLLGGLMEVYSVPSIADALGATHRLETRTWQRILETGRFIHDIHLCGSLSQTGEGTRSIARIRLVHAMVRTRLKARGRDAITQPEMAFTLCAHSHVVRRGLGELGIVLTDAEARAHQHMWRLVGHIMGVDRHFLPTSPRQEAKLYRTLGPQLRGGDPASGRQLAQSAIETIAEYAHLPTSLVTATVRRLVNRPLCDQLGVAAPSRWGSVIAAGRTVARVVNAVRRTAPFFDRIFATAGHTFANLVLSTDPDRGLPVGAAAARGAFAIVSDAKRKRLSQCSIRQPR